MRVGTHTFRELTSKEVLALDQEVISPNSTYYQCNDCELISLEFNGTYLISVVEYFGGKEAGRVSCRQVKESTIREIIE